MDVVVFATFVRGVIEETGIEMPGCLHGKGIEDEFLFLPGKTYCLMLRVEIWRCDVVTTGEKKKYTYNNSLWSFGSRAYPVPASLEQLPLR